MDLSLNWTASVSGVNRFPRHTSQVTEHIGQKAHLDFFPSLAFAFRAATAGDVERKPGRQIPAHLGFRRVGEQFADLIPESHVRRRTRARRLADGSLIDFQHARDVFDAVNLLAPLN